SCFCPAWPQCGGEKQLANFEFGLADRKADWKIASKSVQSRNYHLDSLTQQKWWSLFFASSSSYRWTKLIVMITFSYLLLLLPSLTFSCEDSLSRSGHSSAMNHRPPLSFLRGGGRGRGRFHSFKTCPALSRSSAHASL